MSNDCIYHTSDDGCEKLFVACPSFISYKPGSHMELGCGGCCYCGPDPEDENVEDIEKEEDEEDE